MGPEGLNLLSSRTFNSGVNGGAVFRLGDARIVDRVRDCEGFRAGLETILGSAANLLAVERGDSVISGIEVHIEVEEDVLRSDGFAIAEGDAVLQDDLIGHGVVVVVHILGVGMLRAGYSTPARTLPFFVGVKKADLSLSLHVVIIGGRVEEGAELAIQRAGASAQGARWRVAAGRPRSHHSDPRAHGWDLRGELLPWEGKWSAGAGVGFFRVVVGGWQPPRKQTSSQASAARANTKVVVLFIRLPPFCFYFVYRAESPPTQNTISSGNRTAPSMRQRSAESPQAYSSTRFFFTAPEASNLMPSTVQLFTWLPVPLPNRSPST